MEGRWVSTLIEKDAVPPPGDGFSTNPVNVPGVRSRSADSVASADVSVIVASRVSPSIDTSVSEMNPLPVIESPTAAEPAGTDCGETETTTGTGFDSSVTVKGMEAVVPPPGGGFPTDTATTPTWRSDPDMTTVIDVAVDVNGECRLPPKSTTLVPLKLFPFRVNSSSDAPVSISVGDIDNRTGSELEG